MKQIIDFELKGNLIRFYLGENGKQWGDDWNDAPYEYNAGKVYSEFIQEYVDICVPFDKNIFEPAAHHTSSPWTKEDMIHRRVPCLVVCDGKHWDYCSAMSDPTTVKYFFGDVIPE